LIPGWRVRSELGQLLAGRHGRTNQKRGRSTAGRKLPQTGKNYPSRRLGEQTKGDLQLCSQGFVRCWNSWKDAIGGLFVLLQAAAEVISSVVSFDDDDPDAVGCYELAKDQAHRIAIKMRKSLPSGLDFFLEGFSA
jgi:hypothetical protein